MVADQAGWLADKAQPVSEAMLQAHPDINVLWAANEGGTVAHANAVKTLGLGGKVFVFGTDMNNQMGQMLQAPDDILQGVTGQAPYQMGYDSLATALDVLGGKTVELSHQHADDLLRPRQGCLDQAVHGHRRQGDLRGPGRRARRARPSRCPTRS